MSDSATGRNQFTSSWVIDQVNGNWVKLLSCDHDDLSIELPISLLPSDLTEGQIFLMNLKQDLEASRQEQKQLSQQITELSSTDDGGDFSL